MHYFIYFYSFDVWTNEYVYIYIYIYLYILLGHIIVMRSSITNICFCSIRCDILPDRGST